MYVNGFIYAFRIPYFCSFLSLWAEMILLTRWNIWRSGLYTHTAFGRMKSEWCFCEFKLEFYVYRVIIKFCFGWIWSMKSLVLYTDMIKLVWWWEYFQMKLIRLNEITLWLQDDWCVWWFIIIDGLLMVWIWAF